jgi:hypothetical protein
MFLCQFEKCLLLTDRPRFRRSTTRNPSAASFRVNGVVSKRTCFCSFYGFRSFKPFCPIFSPNPFKTNAQKVFRCLHDVISRIGLSRIHGANPTPLLIRIRTQSVSQVAKPLPIAKRRKTLQMHHQITHERQLTIISFSKLVQR